ncbi:uncharacterized protein LOC143292788 isoform X2 [Babylonia areolata]|uniref:uncharacterized protein LOC143292788 isoform X2 n=1 Tax=Babylonia areolata TaxID=304850 RepID=UPI003FD45C20
MPSNTHTILGGTKRFECRVVGHPRPEIRWFKDGRDITHSGRYNFDHNYDGVISMVIENIGHRDEGHYRCRAENTEGIASTSAYLIVRAHKEHPDEKIDEVHTMALEEHIVFTSGGDHSIMTGRPGDSKMDMETARRRTFEQVVDEEKEITREVLNGTVSKEVSSKKTSETTTSKQVFSKYEESVESKSKRTTIISEETSVSRSSKMKSIQSEDTTKSEDILSISASMDETKVKSDLDETEKGMKVSVETEQSYSSQQQVGQVIVSADSETNEKNKALGRSLQVTEGETSSSLTKDSAKDLITSVSTEEISETKQSSSNQKQTGHVAASAESESTEKNQGLGLSVEVSEGETSSSLAKDSTKSLVTSVSTDEVSTETSRKTRIEQMKMEVKTEVEEVPKECRMEPQGRGEEDTTTVDVIDGAASSLCNDSGFMESSMLDSSQFPADGSVVESALDSSRAETISATTATTETGSTAVSVKTGVNVEESVLEESSTSETPDEIITLVKKSKIITTEENVETVVTSATTVTQETTLVKEVTEGEPDETTTVTTTAAEEAKLEEAAPDRHRPSVSQEVSHAEETVENISGGDITGLLDERPDPATVVEEEVVGVAEEDQQGQRTRWVDQITSRTETLAIEGEGRKVEELSVEQEEAAVATQIQVDQVELSRTTQETGPEVSVDAESLVGRQTSVVEDLSTTQEQLATVNTEAPAKDRKGFEERLEVDEELSAKNVLGLQRTPTSAFDEVESSVDPALQAGKKDRDGVTLKAEVSTEESKTGREDDRQLRVSAESSVAQGEAQSTGLSAPTLVSVPDDVSVQLGQTIRLTSQVQGSPQPEVKWFKEGDSVKAGKRVTLRTEEDVFSLEIREATESDGGTYTLTAHNSEGTIFSDALVTITVPPVVGPGDDGEMRLRATVSVPEFVVQPGKVTVKDLGVLELVCTIKGSPSPTVVWTKDGQTLQSDSHRSVFESEGQYYVTVPRVTVDDAGDYVCTASNSEGAVTCTISVFVESERSSVSEEGAGAMVPLSQLESSSDDLFLRVCEVARAYRDEDTNISFVVGDVVEVLDSKRKSGMWLVRKQAQRDQVCFIPSSYLKEKGEAEADSSGKKREANKHSRSPTSQLDWVDTSEDEDRIRMRQKYPDYVVIADFTPPGGEAWADWLKVTEGQVVEVMDMERADRWLVQTRPTKSSPARQGWVPAAHLEPKSTSSPLQQRSTREVFREEVLQIANKQQEAVLKRNLQDVESEAISPEYAIAELIESEREYVRDLQKLVDSYYPRLGRRSTPSVLKDKRDLIFSNMSDIMDFHNDVFLRILETSAANPGTIGDAFLVKERKFNMYVSYWIDHLATKTFVETEEAQEFLRDYSRSIGDSELTFSRLLESPICRLESYQTLLKDVLRYTARAGEDCSSLERAIAMLAGLENQVRNALTLNNLEGTPSGDVTSLGQLIRHDDMILWDSDVSNARAKDRHLFLFKDKVVITKKKKGESPTDQPSFTFKASVDLQDVQLNENVPEEERRLELWYASAVSEKLTLQTRDLAAKQAWLKDTRELLRALGVEETDIMPEQTVEDSSTQPSPAPVQQQKKKSADSGKPTSPSSPPPTVLDSGSESDRTLTDGDYASLSSYDSDISSYHTAPEFEDGTSRPIFKKRLKKTVCQEGSTVKFDCIVGGNPLPSVRWLKDGAALKESEQVKVTSEGDTSTLTLLSVVSSQAGQYTALAANLNGSVLSAADLVILEELGLEKPEPSQDQESNGTLEDDDNKTPTEEGPSTPTAEPETLLEEPEVTKEASQPEETAGEEQGKTEPVKAEEEPSEKPKTETTESSESAELEKKPAVEEEPVAQESKKVEEEKTVEPEPTPVAEEKKPAVEEAVVEETKKVEEETPAEPEPTLVAEEKKPAVEEPVVPETKKVEEEKPVEPEPTLVAEEKKPVVVEEPVVQETKKVEEEKPVEPEPTPVAEEKKPAVVEEPVVQETKKVEEEKPVEPELTPVAEEKKPAVEEAVVEETKKVEEETPAEPEPTPVAEEKKPAVEEPVVPETKKVEEKKPVEPEPTAVAEEKKPAVVEEPVVQETKKVEEEKSVEPEPTEVAEEKKPAVEEAVVEETKKVEEEKPVEPEPTPVAEEKKPAVVEEPVVQETKKVEEEKPVEPELTPVAEEKKPAVEEAVVEETKKVEEETPAEPEPTPVAEEKKPAVEEPVVPETKKVEEKKPVEPEPTAVAEEKKPAVVEEPVVQETKKVEEEKSVEPEPTEVAEEKKPAVEEAVVEETKKVEEETPVEPEPTPVAEEKKPAVVEEPVVQETKKVEEEKPVEPELTPVAEEKKPTEEEPVVEETKKVKEEKPVEPEPTPVGQKKKPVAEEPVVEETKKVEEEKPVEPEPTPVAEKKKPVAEETVVEETKKVKDEKPVEPEPTPVAEKKKPVAEEPAVEETKKVKEEKPVEPEPTPVGQKKKPVAEEPVVEETKEVKEEKPVEPEPTPVGQKKKPVAEEPVVEETKKVKEEKPVEPEPTPVAEKKKPVAEEPVVEESKKVEEEKPVEPEPTPVAEKKKPVAEEPAVEETKKVKDEKPVEPEPTPVGQKKKPAAEEPVVEETKKVKEEKPVEPEPTPVGQKKKPAAEEPTVAVEPEPTPVAEEKKKPAAKEPVVPDTTEKVEEDKLVKGKAPEAEKPTGAKESEEAETEKLRFKPIPETAEGEIPIRAPHYLSEMNDVVVELGQLARFDCRVAAYPDPEITWLKDGHKVVATDRYELQNFHDDIFSLLIKEVKREDSGCYTCWARNEYGEAKTEALLNVLALKDEMDGDMAPSFATKFGNVECIEGVPVEFTCQIKGRPPPTITWLLNGREVCPSLEILTRQQEDSIMLAFRSVQLEHSGDVVCKLKNHLGEASCRAKLLVKEDLSKKGDIPLFEERPCDLEVTEGGEAKFECVITGTPEPEVLWYFNGRELFDSRRRVIRKKGDQYQLILKEVIPDNAGVYTCKAVNAAGDASCAVELAVKEIPKEPRRRAAEAEEVEYSFPPTFTRRLLDQRVAPGRTARFECLMLGIPLPDVEWQKDGKPLKPSNKLRIGREGSTAILEIDSCEPEDAGEYTCILTNDSGKATSRAGLTVQDEKRMRYSTPRLEARVPESMRAPSRGREDFMEPPSRIRELSPEEKVPSLPFDKPHLLDMRDESVKLSWLPARTTGLPENARQVTYTVEARELPSNRWMRLASGLEGTTHVARNLRPDKEYMFRVYAENKYGPSETTLPATLQAREEPEERKRLYAHEESPAPLKFPSTRPFIMDIGPETLRVGWHPADRARVGQAPVSYRVEAQKLPSEEWIPLASRVHDTSLYLSDLEPDRDYNLRVRAQGPYGVSPPTAPVWLPRAAAFTGVPVSRPQITELEPDTVHLHWQRVDVPAFTHEQDPLTYMIEMQEPPAMHWREVAANIPHTHYIVHDLEPGTDYRFRVRAQTREGLRSEPSPATSIFRTLALSHAPVDRVEVIDYEPEYGSVGLAWRRVEIPPFDSSDEPLLYMIECQEPHSDTWQSLVSGVPTTRYRVPDIGPTADYRFRVRAITPYGVSPPSPAAGLYRSPTPSRPLASDLYISGMEPESMRLSWQPLSLPSSRATTPAYQPPLSYQIEALEHPGSTWRPLASDVRDTSYPLTGLAPTRDYSFRVRALTPAGGLTEPTSPVTVTSLPVRPRLPSREPTIREMGVDSVHLQWPRAELPYHVRESVPITYSIEMQEVPGYTWTPVRRGIPETSYVVKGLRADRDYRFRIRPETEYGPGEYSQPVHAYRKPSVSMPSREPIFSDISPSSVTLTWLPAQVPSGAQSKRPVTYRIEMRESPSGHWIPVAERIPSNRYTVNFLNPDKDYAFRVFAELDGVESEPTAIAYLPHRMGPPKMLREPPYISSVHPDSVLLCWRSVDIPSRITDYAPVTYRIEAQEPPSMEWRPVARHIPCTHHHLQGLRPGQEYNFRVRAENDIGLSEPTPSVLLRKRSVAPTMPAHEPIISDVSPGSLRLSWRPAEVPSYLMDSLPVNYSLYYQHLPDVDWHPLARRVTGTSYFVTGLSPDNNYTFRVQAENQFGSSQPTYPARMPRLAEIPAPIYSPEIEEVEPSAIRLAWKTPKVGPYKKKKTTYAIEALEPDTWTWRPLVSNLSTPSYRVSTLSPSMDYVFRVRAEADKVLSEPSFPISYSRTRAPPSVPVERPILSEVEPDSVMVSWHPVHYPSLGRTEPSRRYKLEMREMPYGSWTNVLSQTSKWSHEVTGLRPNMDYAFRVSAVTDSGTSSPSNAAYLYRRPVIPRTPLEFPELTDVADDAVSLRWKRVDVPAFDSEDEPLSFMIEAQRLPSYDWEPVARGITDTSYRIKGLQPSEDYMFRVRGEMPSGVTTASVPVPLYRRPERTGVPISYVTVDDHNVPPYSARIRWKPVYLPHYTSPSSNLYQVEVRETPQRDWQTLSRDVRGSEFTVADLSPRKTYMFRVRARSPAGELSEPSMSVPFYPLHLRAYQSTPGREFVPMAEDYSLPNRPYINTLIVKVPPRMHIEKPDMYSVNPTTVHLSWNTARVPASTSQLSPTTYRVEVRQDGTFNWVERASNITGLGCDIGGLDPMLDYAFRVRAVNDFGWSEATLPVFLHRPLELNYEEPDIDWETISPAVPPLVPPRLPIDSPRMTPVADDSLRLSWHPARIPAYARKAPITYVVEMKDPSGTAWAPVASKLDDTSYQVRGLEPTRPYLFRVRAESEFGSSDPTLPAEFSRTKPTAPRTRSQSVERLSLTDYDLTTRRGSFIDSITSGVPPRVPAGRPTITNATETSLTLSWPAARLPAYLKNTKLDYIIEYRDAPSRLWANLAENVADTTYKVTGLDPEQDYMFRVRAHNDHGTSEPTLPATLERPKKKATTPQRRGSSVERRSLDRRSMDRMGSEQRRSLSRTSLDRRSESRLSRSSRRDGDDLDTLPGMTPEDSPQAPQFSSLAEEAVQYGVESHPMTISLQLRGYPPPEVTWYHQGKKLELGDRYDTYITPTGQVFLEFLNMGWDDIGDYRCVAENELGTAEKTVKIDVADPPTFIEPLRDITVVERGQGVLSCSVDGIPYPSVRFMKDWRPMTDTSRLVATRDPQQPDRWTMTINNAIPADSGSYMCVAENVAGKIFSTSRVNVEDDAVSGLLPSYKDASLEDNYYVLEEIGRGRHGRVRRVIEKNSGKEFAAKFIQVRDAVDKEFFRSELDNLRRQNHKNIVPVHDAYETPRQLIIVTELLGGGELLDRVVNQGQWTEGKAAGVVKQLLETLQHVHSHGIVHMDIKPSNLLLSGDTLDSAKLIDFGLARRLPPTQDTFLNHGTPGFTSPEALDVKPISTASDVWGVGVLAYILLGGQSPFQADSVADSLKKTQACDWNFDVCKPFSTVSKDAKDFISQILKKDPDDRPTVDECLAHPWLKKTDGGASIDVAPIKAFQDRDKKQRQSTAARTVAYLRTLQRQLTGGEVSEKGLRPAVDPTTGAVSFPDIEAYGEFLDSESWYEWQSRYGQGPDSGLLPLKDPEYTARIRGYKRSTGSVDSSAFLFDDEGLSPAERERFKMMKERRKMADIDKEEIPPSLEKELQWLEERKQARKTREPQRQGSVDSRRSSISTEGEAGGPVPVFRQRLQDLTFETGDTITMYCALEGPPPYSTVWYKNEELLSDGTRVKQELYEDGQATLTITAAKPYDAGVYKCVARSKSGRASSRMRLLQGDVPERPGRPAVLQIAANELILMWEAPRFDGNCPILYYRVDYKAAGDSRWTSCVYTPLETCVVSGLKPETPYRLRVSAANLLGRGPFSWSSVEVTTTKQGSISSLRLGDLTLDQLKQRQEEGKEIASKPRESEASEEAPVDTSTPTLQTGEPSKEYVLGDTLWKGQFGELKEGSNKKTSKHCLVKCVPTSLPDSQREFDVLKTMRHETILRLQSAFSTPTTLFLVFDDVPGIHVAQRLSLRRRYSEDNVAYIIRQVLYALQYLHRNSVIHLNLQPAALLVSSRHGLDIRLADFSMAHVLTNGAEGVSVPRKGYPDFIAPEVVVKDKASPASDVWGVGTLTFLLLSGLSPFAGSSDEETLINVAYSRYDAGDLLDGVSHEALKFLFKVMKRLPSNRPTVLECLEHKWLQLTDAMMKTREANLFRSNRLRQFVKNYDARRQSKDLRILFDDLVLPPELVATLQPDVLTSGKKDSEAELQTAADSSSLKEMKSKSVKFEREPTQAPTEEDAAESELTAADDEQEETEITCAEEIIAAVRGTDNVKADPALLKIIEDTASTSETVAEAEETPSHAEESKEGLAEGLKPAEDQPQAESVMGADDSVAVKEPAAAEAE